MKSKFDAVKSSLFLLLRIDRIAKTLYRINIFRLCWYGFYFPFKHLNSFFLLRSTLLSQLTCKSDETDISKQQFKPTFQSDISRLTHDDEGPVVKRQRQHDQSREPGREHADSPEGLEDHSGPAQLLFVLAAHPERRAVGRDAPPKRDHRHDGRCSCPGRLLIINVGLSYITTVFRNRIKQTILINIGSNYSLPNNAVFRELDKTNNNNC